MSRHKKAKVKYIYREKSSPDLEKKAKEEIENLEKQKMANVAKAEMEKAGKNKISKVLTGFQYGLGRMNIQREINARREFLRGQQQIRNIRTKVEVENAREKLHELQKKNTLKLEDLHGGLVGGTGRKQVKFEDIF